MADKAIMDRITVLKKQLADAQKTGNPVQIENIKKRLDDFMKASIATKKIRGSQISLENYKSFFQYLDDLQEEGEVGMGVPDVTGSAINTTNVGGQFAAKIGDQPIFTRNKKKKKSKKRKIRKESVDNYVDNLFE